MDFERALETQRLKLLRFLAGLAFVVVLVSRFPAVSMVPRWVRASVLSRLVRVESAINSLIIVAAVTVCGYRGKTLLPPALILRDDDREDVPAARLLREIARLQAILDDLPRFARRLVQRMTRSNSIEPQIIPPVARDGGLVRVVAPYFQRIERPPISPQLSLMRN